MNDYQYDYYYYNNNSENVPDNISVFLFTDRSIYRPGQTLYFKGITIGNNQHDRKYSIKSDYETVIYLRNPNGQLTDSMPGISAMGSPIFNVCMRQSLVHIQKALESLL